MPRVNHVKKARKDNPAAKAGEPYYWWKFRYGGKRYSKTYPRRSALTNSEHYSLIYDLEDDMPGVSSAGDVSALMSYLEDAKGSVDSWRDELEGRRSSVEEAFPGGSPTLDLLETRTEAMETLINEIDEVIDTLENLGELDMDDKNSIADFVDNYMDGDPDDHEPLDIESEYVYLANDATSGIMWDVGE